MPRRKSQLPRKTAFCLLSSLLCSSSVALFPFAAPGAFAQPTKIISTSPVASEARPDETDALMNALLSAATDEARRALLRSQRDELLQELPARLLKRGEVSRVRGEYAAALALHKLALDVATERKDETNSARAFDRIGRVRHFQNEYQEAMASYEGSLALLTKLGGKEADIADVYNDMGRTHFTLRDYDAAQASYERALKFAESGGNKTASAWALSGFGIVRFHRGDPQAAMEFYERSLSLSRAVGEQELAGMILHNIALVHRSRGDFRLAIENYEAGIKAFEELGARSRIAHTLINLSNAYKSIGDANSAARRLQQSVALAEAVGDKQLAGMALNNTGLLHFNQGNYDLALHYFQKSLALREAIGLKAQTISVLNSIASVHREQGRYERALETLTKSLALSEGVKEPRLVASVHETRGDVRRAQGEYSLALDGYQKSLAIVEKLGNKQRIAHLLALIGAVYEAQGEHALALEHAERAALISRQIYTPDTLWRALVVAGQARRKLKQNAEGRAAFEEAIAVIEDLRGQTIGGERERHSFLADKLVPYTALVELQLERGDARAAFALAERAKARVLLDVLRGGRTEISKALTAAERERAQSLSRDLTAANEQLAREGERDGPDAARLEELRARQRAARLAYEEFQATLYAAHPELRVQLGAAPIVTPEDVRALVPDDDTALVEYLVAENRTFLFVITKAKRAPATPIAERNANAAPTATLPVDLRVLTLDITRAELTSRIARFREQLAARGILFRAEAEWLYQTLLAPAAAQLAGRERLIVAPDGVLWELPFQALLTPQGAYVVERHAVSYAPSLTVLGEIAHHRATRAARAAGASDLLAFGNPQRGGAESAKSVGENLMNRAPAALPEAERQVRVLAALYGKNRSRVYTGADAAEERLKSEAGNYRILHLATHGVLDDTNPMYSYVLLAARDKSAGINDDNARAGSGAALGDGRLEAWELMSLDLRAEMVVLSACETARGRVASGEGMIGLAWALFVAGSPVTVVSQWKVESASTTELMLGFYRNLEPSALRRAPALPSPSSRMTKAEALRRASLALLRSEKYGHPFYWAGFVIVGDAE